MMPLTEAQKLTLRDAMNKQPLAAIGYEESSSVPPLDFSEVRPEVRKRGRFVDYSAVPMSVLQWLWPDRVPLGKLTLFCGPPGIGKTSVGDDLIARVTSGLLSDIPGRVLVLAEEDSLSDTKTPRLAAMGANLRLVTGLAMTIVPDETGKEFERDVALSTDLDVIKEWLTANRTAKLVVVDPITNYLGQARMNSEQDVRVILTPLARVAEEFNVAILLIGHFNKNKDGDAITRASGATAFVGVPRIVWNFSKDADNEAECLMASPKNVHLKSQRYRIVEKEFTLADGRTTKTAVVDWLGESATSADENLRQLNDPERGKMDRAIEWLKENLWERTEAGIVLKKCTTACYCCEETVKRAATKWGGVEKIQEGGRYYWVRKEVK